MLSIDPTFVPSSNNFILYFTNFCLGADDSAAKRIGVKPQSIGRASPNQLYAVGENGYSVRIEISHYP